MRAATPFSRLSILAITSAGYMGTASFLVSFLAFVKILASSVVALKVTLTMPSVPATMVIEKLAELMLLMKFMVISFLLFGPLYAACLEYRMVSLDVASFFLCRLFCVRPVFLSALTLSAHLLLGCFFFFFFALFFQFGFSRPSLGFSRPSYPRPIYTRPDQLIPPYRCNRLVRPELPPSQPQSAWQRR